MTDDANNDQQSSVTVDENDDDSNLNASLFEVDQKFYLSVYR